MAYTAKNLEDVAKAFDHRAWQVTAFSDRLHKTQRDKRLAERESQTWRRAAQQIRETTLEGLDAIRAGLDYASEQFALDGDPGEDTDANLTAARDALERLERKG